MPLLAVHAGLGPHMLSDTTDTLQNSWQPSLSDRFGEDGCRLFIYLLATLLCATRVLSLFLTVLSR